MDQNLSYDDWSDYIIVVIFIITLFGNEMNEKQKLIHS